jgi:hypothetical protein
VRCVDREFCSIVANTRKVGAEERKHDRHSGLGQYFVVPLSDPVGDKDQKDDTHEQDLIAVALSQLLEG